MEASAGVARGEVEGGDMKESDDDSELKWDGKSPTNASGLCPTGDDEPQRVAGGDIDAGL